MGPNHIVCWALGTQHPAPLWILARGHPRVQHCLPRQQLSPSQGPELLKGSFPKSDSPWDQNEFFDKGKG